jgi:hypothetical protein
MIGMGHESAVVQYAPLAPPPEAPVLNKKNAEFSFDALLKSLMSN